MVLLWLPVLCALGQNNGNGLSFYLPVEQPQGINQRNLTGSMGSGTMNTSGRDIYRPPYAAMTCLFLAGMADGTVEILRHDYDNFKKVFPGARDSYWNSEVSWKNKWKDGDPAKGEKFFQSAYLLAWTTDGYHLLRSANKALICGAIVFHIGDRHKPFVHYLYDFAICSATYTAGFTTTYSLIFKH